MRGAGSRRRMGWPRAVGLTAITALLSIANPAVLIAVPLSLMTIFLPVRSRLTLLVAAGVAVLAFGGAPVSGFWYFERGWVLLLSGWFLALTLRWPEWAFLPRGLGAVAGTFGAMGLLFWSRPGQWAVVDWAVTSRMERGMATALQAARVYLGPEVVPVATETRLLEAMALQGMVFPAMVGLASLAALGTAWWLYLRLNRALEVGIRPLVEFRFNDQLVWVLILGFALLLGSSGLVERVGINAVVFMGTLYAFRGVA
ncbi:MAG: hypothetical protein ACWGSQ_05330, partial [Longimicrobiales bacterium]